MPSAENWKEVAIDYSLDLKAAHQRINDLEEKLRVLGVNYDHLVKEMRALPGPQAPGVIDEDEHDCGKCNAGLDEEWSYCPWCGSEIDWDAIEDDDWYADEGERFLRAEVYEPLKEAMRR